MQLALCADATESIGAGHVMRLLVLAEAWTGLNHGPVVLCGEVTIDFVRHRLESLGVRRVDAPSGDGVSVVDSYDPAKRERFGKAAPGGLRVLVDDLGGAVPGGYRMVWNPNAYGEASMYSGFDGDVVTGPEAVPIREGLPRWTAEGGMDTALMLGGGTPPPAVRDAVRLLVEKLGPGRVRAVRGWVGADTRPVDPRDPWRAIASSRRLLTAGGSTVWEACAVGVPVVVVRTASNQELVAGWAERQGVPVVDGEAASDARELAERLVTGLEDARPLPRLTSGAARVAARIRDGFGASSAG